MLVSEWPLKSKECHQSSYFAEHIASIKWGWNKYNRKHNEADLKKQHAYKKERIEDK